MGDPIGLYIHIPFCRRRCDYCDFTTTVEPESKWTPYIDAVVRELKHWRPYLQQRTLHSVYLGGGTPSLLGSERIGRILDAARANFTMDPNVEITLEANPETISLQLVEALRKAGVNRLSLGVQSFQPLLLEKLNRYSSQGAVEQALYWARKIGFENVSLDLIYGIPGQSLDDWQGDLEQAVALKPEHLSTYELTLEADTPMGQRVSAGRERLPEEETIVAMYERAQVFLPRQGYGHYEISNFARPGRECVHNLRTWQQGEYLGVGLAAHSHVCGRRFRNTRSLEAYLAGTPIGSTPEAPGHYDLRWPNGEERWAEALILGLRLTAGVALKELDERIGAGLPQGLLTTLHEFQKQGILERLDGRLRLTHRGRLLSDTLFAELVR